MSLRTNPLSTVQLAALNQLVEGLTKEQVIWLNGYFEGRMAVLDGFEARVSESKNETVAPENLINLSILYGTETGHSQALAEKLQEKASFKGVNARIFSLYDYDFKELSKEENVAVIVSTHGEGDPPDMAEDFYRDLTGADTLNLENMNYSILALGDKTYKHFCKAGEDLDEALKSRGAYRSTQMVKCDVDYERPAEIWMNNFLLSLSPSNKSESNNETVSIFESNDGFDEDFSRTNPYMATVLHKERITAEESDKEVYHVELSLEGSGLEYEPGDSLGIFTKNPEDLVARILSVTGFDPEQKVDVPEGEVSIKEALSHHLEITLLTFDLLNKYQQKSQNAELAKLIADDDALDEYLYGHDVLDLLEDYPFNWNANKLVEVLRPIPPRLYSISSSMESVGEEVHVTISVVRYERKNRKRNGACSSHLADIIEVDELVPVYIEKNPGFKLPANGSKIIMIGAGTGVAPYRAFMQHRESLGIDGESWLFFGNRHFESDYLYQSEWVRLKEDEVLTKIDVAFSRDQEEKVYVQHKLIENQKDVFEWLESGAHLYLCGDMKYMAKDVNKTLLEIIQVQGGITEEQAKKYVKNLRKEKRFQIDVY